MTSTHALPPPAQRVGGRTVYTLAGNAFGSGSASLTAQAQASLRALAGKLRGGSEAVSIVGYTDSQGADEANLALSRLRAEAVRRALEDSGDIPLRGSRRVVAAKRVRSATTPAPTTPTASTGVNVGIVEINGNEIGLRLLRSRSR